MIKCKALSQLKASGFLQAKAFLRAFFLFDQWKFSFEHKRFKDMAIFFSISEHILFQFQEYFQIKEF